MISLLSLSLSLLSPVSHSDSLFLSHYFRYSTSTNPTACLSVVSCPSVARKLLRRKYSSSAVVTGAGYCTSGVSYRLPLYSSTATGTVVQQPVVARYTRPQTLL